MTTAARKACQLAWFVFTLHMRRVISRAQALNALDRLASRMDRQGEAHSAESISTLYMMCYK